MNVNSLSTIADAISLIGLIVVKLLYNLLS